MNLTDYICYFASKIIDLSYLEIGVSVGRNFWQVLHACKNASLTGYDMDNLYPIIRNRLQSLSCEIIPTQHVSVRAGPPQKECLFHGETNNTVSFVSGDEFDDSLWDVMKGQKFNLIFSDATHTPEALLYEWSKLQGLGLLNQDGFTMLWDDLSSRGMRRAFETICRDACKTLRVSPNQCAFLHVPGWIGRYEPPHGVGIISSSGFVA